MPHPPATQPTSVSGGGPGAAGPLQGPWRLPRAHAPLTAHTLHGLHPVHGGQLGRDKAPQVVGLMEPENRWQNCKSLVPAPPLPPLAPQMKNEEMRVAYLSHGLQHLRRVVLPSPVRHVAHQPLARTLVALDAASTLHFLQEDGTYRGCRQAPAPATGLLYAAQVDRFVAWGEWALQVLDGGLRPLSRVQSAQPIRCGAYSERLNRVVTAGPGNLTLWDFRYGARSLQCRAAVCEGLSPQDVFSHLALDAGSAAPQRCFACCDSGAAAFDLSAGKLLSFQKELHSRAITDITYCEAIGSAVTASRDTTIKAWDEDWHVQTVFVGHTAPVVAVTAYPQRPLLFSASQDGTIRTWNLNTVDQVDQVHVAEPVEALETQSASLVISLSGPSLNFWKISKLYCLHTPLGSPAVRLRCVDLRALGDFPVRVLCVCRDGSVRLLEAESGRPCSTLALERPGQAHEVDYCLPLETLFVLTERGDLLRVNAAVDPMAVKKSTLAGAWDSRPGCLLLYSHTVDAAAAHSTWLRVAESKGLRKPWQKLPLPMQDKNRYLVILGHQSGFLSVVEWFSGRVQYTVAAHGPMPVTALAEYPTQTCVISAGADLTVKMWRLFPYAEECLLPLLCFSCSCPATHVCALGETLAVAFQDPETVTYSVVFYNLVRQTRMEHSPEDDAQDSITGLCHCPNLKLFASASRDGSVKIWDARNRLLRHLKLNSIPESLAFANPRGDLLVGIERHLYLIHHSKYLPSYYKMKVGTAAPPGAPGHGRPPSPCCSRQAAGAVWQTLCGRCVARLGGSASSASPGRRLPFPLWTRSPPLRFCQAPTAGRPEPRAAGGDALRAVGF
uniref:Uncharacterized protein n=1 Tax=Varanus komodoensis TaxID=61221 RepID=A0A8D2IU48_VARKO